MKKWLLKKLGVRALIERAFREGWQMAHDDDFSRLQREGIPHKYTGGQPAATIYGTTDLRNVVNNSRCWRSVGEAWVSSDVEEEV
jgi:hypothetical protein